MTGLGAGVGPQEGHSQMLEGAGGEAGRDIRGAATSLSILGPGRSSHLVVSSQQRDRACWSPENKYRPRVSLCPSPYGRGCGCLSITI